jgi:serine/threonine-protein kinase
MSRVFVAQDTRLARKVVVKVLSPELGAALSMERFEREIRVAASLQQGGVRRVSGRPLFASRLLHKVLLVGGNQWQLAMKA